MKVYVKFFNIQLRPDQRKVIDDFILYHQKLTPLKNDIEVHFFDHRLGRMTTGSRTGKRVLKILAKNRMLIDILRTLSHEWVHEYEHENLKMDFSQDIGGEAEDLANAKAGAFLKMFQRDYPQYLGIIYE